MAPTDEGVLLSNVHYSSNSINDDDDDDDDDDNEMSSLCCSAKQRSGDYGTRLDTARDCLGSVRRNVMHYKITDSMKCSPMKMLSMPINKTVHDN